MGGHSLSWAAGFLDGEAYFSTTGRISCEICVEGIDPKPLRRLRALFGGSLVKLKRIQDGCRQAWRWRVTGENARQAARKVRSEMTSKKGQAMAVALSERWPADSDKGSALRQYARNELTREYA